MRRIAAAALHQGHVPCSDTHVWQWTTALIGVSGVLTVALGKSPPLDTLGGS